MSKLTAMSALRQAQLDHARNVVRILADPGTRYSPPDDPKPAPDADDYLRGAQSEDDDQYRSDDE